MREGLAFSLLPTIVVLRFAIMFAQAVELFGDAQR